MVLIKGYGVNKSEEKAVKLYETAADKGNIESATYLSQLYFKGIDQIIPRDRNKFKQYYDQVCSEDQFDACLELKGSIMDECGSIYGADSILDPNSDIDPICRALFAPVLRIINGFVK
ncbi:unnamed protein product [Commensalibacter communis]|uniref:Sel1 repeat-containing protein n=1 Tax=Commensalibacter communis TaxID=2972786 RepID=A0A9W4TQ53_9PROT|nr:unnamed protein product [Commensalibacter communis]CAI3950666.1 unnamed protein product [Commensalibacter communis]CAI3952344.1 unnamed protein product [Commensalibacter communis]CAI3953471.1 unnamed protein product [Commensalibacter communis]